MIQPVEKCFRKVRFAPKLIMKLRHVNARYESVSGTYVSNWKINEDGAVTVHVEVPFYYSAELVLPNYEGGSIPAPLILRKSQQRIIATYLVLKADWRN
ncbi:MAG: alpha-L-rhamnosidase C-terminal domain-containing protein [Bacillota bacterium]